MTKQMQGGFRTVDDCKPRYTIVPHPTHPRLRHIEIDRTALEEFFTHTDQIDVQNLEYVPFMRFVLGSALAAWVGDGFAELLAQLTNDRSIGGFTTGLGGLRDDPDSFVKFGTAIGHLLGPANHDAMSGTYYARFIVQDTDKSDSYLRQAYRLFTLHTDGTFVEDATDWLLMMKFAEQNATGGESRFLHLDDWDELERFRASPYASHDFLYKSPGSKNVDTTVRRPLFFESKFGLSMSFIDQFVQPQSMQEAVFLNDLSASMEAAAGTREVPLPVGDLVVLNNFFWLHGRAAFQKHDKLHRELMRQRGFFA
ncbi:glutarate dioxygenase GlaH [Sphingobium nicotianae]|uniref:Carbon starvation induced protein CsiD n=1 Tax=Sphingobium nicotianae TaxID=2782607 RepID=A0A9X1D9V9_9SPHN|nr:glutarate dioxygenase GlaH [Sphingobium nicotianae]MBT2186053.1 carbon starvation induced protein CsiD [Sphingobium nicotianae]